MEKIIDRCGVQVVINHDSEGAHSITYTFHQKMPVEKAERLILRLPTSTPKKRRKQGNIIKV